MPRTDLAAVTTWITPAVLQHGPCRAGVIPCPCLIGGTIPKDVAHERCIIGLLRIDPRWAKDPNLDMKDMYRTSRTATALALNRALNDDPGVEEPIG
jgi:formaldehyde-activating enzyme involved in methanogenesis